jgi:CheY-like chemotaxis protein
VNRTFFLRCIFCIIAFVPWTALGTESGPPRLTVLTPWHRTQIAYTAWGLLALAGFFAVARWRSTDLLRKKIVQHETANGGKFPAATTATFEVAENAAPLRALIVEDIECSAAAMQAVLRKLGVQSEVARDGHTALERLQSSFHDLAFIDWNLPGLIGPEVVTRYRATEAPGRRTIIIATTVYSAASNRDACVEAGMDAFIAKPFAPEKISATLYRLRGSLRPVVFTKWHEPVERVPPLGEIDLRVLRFLAEESTDGLGKQIERYLGFFESDRSAARKIVAAGNVREIHRVAHRLAGHASMVNFEPLVSLASELQTHAAGRNPAKLAELFAKFDREFEKFRSKLELFRASTEPV